MIMNHLLMLQNQNVVSVETMRITLNPRFPTDNMDGSNNCYHLYIMTIWSLQSTNSRVSIYTDFPLKLCQAFFL